MAGLTFDDIEPEVPQSPRRVKPKGLTFDDIPVAVAKPEDVRGASGVPGGTIPEGTNIIDTPEEMKMMRARQTDEKVKEIVMSPISGAINAGVGMSAIFDRFVPWVANHIRQNQRYFSGEPFLTEEEQAAIEQQQAEWGKPLADMREMVRENVYKPQTDVGEALATGGAFMLGGWPSRATRLAPTAANRAISYGGDLTRNVAVPAVTSEALGSLFEGSDYETAARLVGGGAGSVAATWKRGIDPIERTIQNATRRETEASWNNGQRLSDLSRRVELPATGPELMSEATGGASPLTNIQRYVEGDPIHGAGVMGPYMAARPAATRAATQVILDQVGPQSARPTALGADAGRAADDVIETVMGERRAAAEPHYTAANPMTVPQDAMTQVLDDIDAAIAADTTGVLQHSLGELRDRLIARPATTGTPAVPGRREPVLDPRSGQLLSYRNIAPVPEVPATPRQPALDIENIDRTRKYMRDTLDTIGTSSNPNRAAYQGEQGAVVSGFLQRLDNLMEQSSPEFAQGKQVHRRMTEDVVNPVVEGPVGQVKAAGGNTQAAVNAINPLQPLTGSADEIRDAVTRLHAADPATTRQLVRQSLGDRFEKAMEETQQGNAEYGGAKFHKSVAGTPTKRAVTEASIAALPNGMNINQQLGDLLEVMHATGRRKPTGSATEFNRSLTDELGASPNVSLAELVATGGRNYFAKVGDMFNRWAKQSHVRSLGDLFIDPNSVALMRQMSERRPSVTIPEGLVRAGTQGLGVYYGDEGREDRR